MRFGLGLRPLHYQDILETKPPIDWFEIITEDFIEMRGRDWDWLQKILSYYPVSLHGVSLNIGSVDPLRMDYLKALKKLIRATNPMLISDHICWTGVNQINTHDLLPLPLTEEAITHVVDRVKQIQDFLGRQIMLENISSYIQFQQSDMTEWEFIAEIADRADCFILLDINNIYVNACNHRFSATAYLNHIAPYRIKQFHLAGHKHCETHIIDTHDADIISPVWNLYAGALKRFGPIPLIIERDSNIPPLSELLKELEIARRISHDHQ